MEKKSSVMMNVEAQMRLNAWKRENEKARSWYPKNTMFNLGMVIATVLLLRK